VTFDQQVGYTGRYLDKETGLWYFRARYYSGTLGRFIGRDPLGYVDGLGLYSAYYIPYALDPYGLESETETYGFVAIADRTVSGTGGLFNHYSVQHWECECPIDEEKIKIHEIYKITEVPKKIKCEKKNATELLNVGGWEITYSKTIANTSISGPYWDGSYITHQGIDNVGISVIFMSDKADKDLSPAFVGSIEETKGKWDVVVAKASSYEYGEQDGFGGNFANWPNSEYKIGDDVNNSNTFAREILKRSGLFYMELPGAHPGRFSPKSDGDRYGGATPTKKK